MTMPGFTREQIQFRLDVIERQIDAAEDVGREAPQHAYDLRQQLEAQLAELDANPAQPYAREVLQ